MGVPKLIAEIKKPQTKNGDPAAVKMGALEAALTVSFIAFQSIPLGFRAPLGQRNF